ncbi:MAG: amidohydrolase family protein [Planctomycetes bacterium]|nr:amidohydrolase family protein [Planctomycetota bacterium]
MIADFRSRIAESRLKIAVLLLLCVACSTSAVNKTAQDEREVLVIKGGKVKTLSSGDIDNGIIIISGKQIKKITTDPKDIPQGAKIIDAKGKTIIPGYFDSFTSIGLIEINQVIQTNDLNEKGDIFVPQLSTQDAFNAQSELIRVARVNGVTTILSAPGFTNVIAGKSSIVNLSDDLDFNERAVRKNAAIHINFDTDIKILYPDMVETRMGMLAKIRENFIKASEYLQKKKKYSEKLQDYQKKMETSTDEEKKKLEKPEPPDTELKLETLADSLEGKIPVIIHADRADDILRAINLSKEFGFKLILAGCVEGWKVAEIIAKKKIPVILGPVNAQPSSVDTFGASYQNAFALYKNGVKFSIASFDSHNSRNLPYLAGLACSYGLPIEEGLKAITLYPAEIFGVDNLVGCIKEGALANLVIFDGSELSKLLNDKNAKTDDPFQPLAKIEKVFIEGREIPFENHQTELREKYRRK